jgi:hypothetical protein
VIGGIVSIYWHRNSWNQDVVESIRKTFEKIEQSQVVFIYLKV